MPHVHLRKGRSSFRDLKRSNSRLLRDDVRRGTLVYRGLPEVIAVNHTDICNLRCVMCPRHEKQGRHRLSRSTLAYLAESLFPTAHKAVLTTATGEPLAADFDFLLAQALRYDVKIDILTNGVLLTGDLYHQARSAFDHLNISLDCHVPDVYERIRIGARFATVRANLEAIADQRRREPDDVLLSLSAVVMRSNLDHLAGLVEFAGSIDADGVVLQRLRHEVRATTEEDPFTHFGEERVWQRIAEAEDAARRVGVNLFMTELGRPAVLSRRVREKIPTPIEGQGLCWFLAQYFSVMYTGEVYPCCIPTDFRLGNVLYQDPVAIWNGRRLQELRAAHRSARGNLFCSGCLHAPHLAGPRYPRLAAGLRGGRIRAGHVANHLRRSLAARTLPRIYDPPFPDVRVRHDRYVDGGVVLHSEPVELGNEALAPAVADGDPAALWLVRGGCLYRTCLSGVDTRLVARLREEPAPQATLLRFVDARTALIAFEEEGVLCRLDRSGDGFAVRTVLDLSTPRSFIRQGAVAIDQRGRIWVGEYGIHPGARCAWLYRSDDGGRSFVRVAHLDRAKHIHAIAAITDPEGILVTTGDLGSERRLYLVSPGRRVRLLRKTWSGFTAIAETERFIHFGTDLDSGNGLLRWSRGLRGELEFRPMPAAIDLQVRQFLTVPGGRLLALTGMDADLGQRYDGRRAVVLVSSDEGDHWSVAHRFSADWEDVPEGLVACATSADRFVSVCVRKGSVLELPVQVGRGSQRSK